MVHVTRPRGILTASNVALGKRNCRIHVRQERPLVNLNRFKPLNSRPYNYGNPQGHTLPMCI